MDKAQWTDASRCINAALKAQPASPTNPMLFANLGICQTELGQYNDALRSFEIALIKNPDSPKILTNRARTHIYVGNDSDAISDLTRALACDSIYTRALFMRSSLLMKMSRLEEAEADLNVLARHGLADANVLASLGRCASVRGDIKESQRLFSQALREGPEPDTYVIIAVEQINNNLLNEAEETVYQGIKDFPREGELYLVRALLHRRRFQNNEAEIDKKIAMEYGVESQIIESFFPGEPLPRRK
ncbi:MAG: tetratricopeptide repeat protein [Muribaculum sp.]|nr:tetratricopeptide repeat protein [Muribaculum sp.]